MRGLGKLRLPAFVIALVAAAVIPATGAAAAPTARDVASARAFVSALTRFYKAAAAREPRARVSAGKYIAGVAAGCSGVVPSSLSSPTPAQQSVLHSLGEEAGVDLALAYLAPDKALVHREIAALRKLHFSRGAINRDIASGLATERAVYSLKRSDICADFKAAAAVSFDSLPPATTQFLAAAVHVLNENGVGGGNLLSMVKADLPVAERGSATRLKKLDTSYQRASNRDISAEIDQLLGALTSTSSSTPTS